jgi:uncharacterized membrane protein
VLGIEGLSQGRRGRRISKGRARIAALCAVIPGGGAIYNHQHLKAVLHFFITVGLFQLSVFGKTFTIFALGGAVFYLYSIIDAYRNGEAISRGENPREADERLKRWIAKHAPALGFVLFASGLILFLQTVRPFGFELSLAILGRLIPVGLIFLGGYLVVSRIRRGAPGARRQDESLIIHTRGTAEKLERGLH